MSLFFSSCFSCSSWSLLWTTRRCSYDIIVPRAGRQARWRYIEVFERSQLICPMAGGSSIVDDVLRGRRGRATISFGGWEKMCWTACSLPEMVRLETLATWTRAAGRATWAMDEARREARTRVEAIATDGEEMVARKKEGMDWGWWYGAGQLGCLEVGSEGEKMRVEVEKDRAERSGESGGTGTARGPGSSTLLGFTGGGRKAQGSGPNHTATQLDRLSPANEQRQRQHTNPLTIAGARLWVTFPHNSCQALASPPSFPTREGKKERPETQGN